MRVLTISGAFYPKIDGSVIAVANLVRGLTSRGNEVTVLARGYGPGTSSDTWKGMSIVRVVQRGGTLPYRFLFAFDLFRVGSKLVRSHRFDVIHAHGFTSLLVAEVLKVSSRIPVVVTFHGLQRLWVRDRGFIASLSYNLMIPLEGLLARRADTVVSQSEMLKNVLITLYRVKAESVRIVPNPIDSNGFRFHKADPKSRTVLFVGTFGTLYAPDILLRAAGKVIQRIPDAKFVFIGDGPLLDYTSEMAKELGIDENVEFVGRVTDRRLLEEYYASSRFLVVPFRGRGGYILSLAALESLAVGRPVLIGYEVDRTPGVLRTSNDPVEMANGIVEMLTRDFKEYSRVCDEARLSVEGYDADSAALRIENIYTALIGKS